jgi:TPR repeat protein
MYQLWMIHSQYQIESAMIKMSRAATIGNYTPAQRWMGWFCTEGCKLATFGKDDCPNYDKAMQCYRRAADQNDAPSAAAIARLYEHGLGVKTNVELAIKWYQKAVDLGDATSKVKLEILLEQKER